MIFTVLGASGFIGSHLAATLDADGHDVRAPGRHAPLAVTGDLGHVIYCVGVTADFRGRPLDTVDAHVCRLMPLLRRGGFQSLLYLSSTRLYGAAGPTHEDAPIACRPGEPDELYNISKLMGEAACLSADLPNVRIARLTNVYGIDFRSENFLSSVLRDAVNTGRVNLNTDLKSAKDYIAVDDVVAALTSIACEGNERIYNVASGQNVSNDALTKALRKLTRCRVAVAPGAAHRSLAPIEVGRLRDEFGHSPASLLDRLPALVTGFKERLASVA